MSKSHVSRICAELDGAVGEFRERRLDHIEFPYVFLDATYVKAHDGAHVVSKAIVVATGVAADGNREVLGLAVGDSEDATFWTRLPAHRCGPAGWAGCAWSSPTPTKGCAQAIDKVMLGAAWQRCRVHFLRNVLARVPKGSAEMVAAAIRTIFAQPDAAAVAEQLHSIADKLGRQFPAVAAHAHATPKPTCAPSPPSPTPTGASQATPGKPSLSHRPVNRCGDRATQSLQVFGTTSSGTRPAWSS